MNDGGKEEQRRRWREASRRYYYHGGSGVKVVDYRSVRGEDSLPLFAVGPKGCWLWLHYQAPSGYGRWTERGQKIKMAHRVVWEAFNGPIPPGLVLDHLCRVRCCINPAHLEMVTPAENNRRSPTVSTLNAQKKACYKGHPFTLENTGARASGRYRQCLACSREKWAAAKARGWRRRKACA